MKKYIFLVIVSVINVVNSFAQVEPKLPSNFLQAMQGDWTGKLTYTDYQDDATQVVMDVWLKSNITDKYLIKQFFYVEPDGKTKQRAKSQDTAYIVDNGAGFMQSGYKRPFKLISYTTKQSSVAGSAGLQEGNLAKVNTLQIAVFETKDEDNEKPSTIRTTISVTSNAMSIVKEVKYDETNQFFIRNSFFYAK